MAEGLGVGAVGGEEAAEGRPKHSFFVRLEGIRAYHRRGWWTPARLGPATSTSETPTERQAVADPRFPDPPVQPLRFLQTDTRLFVFSPFAKAQTSALNYVCGSEKPLRLRLRWVEGEEEAGREAVVGRTSERAPLAYPGLSAQLDKDVLEEGESGELRVAWSGTEAVPHVARPLHLELCFWPADEAERGGQRGLRGALEAEVLFRTLPSVTFCPEPRLGPGLDPAPDHLTLYRPYKGSRATFSAQVLSDHTCWMSLSTRGKVDKFILIPGPLREESTFKVYSRRLSASQWEKRRAEVVLEWREAADGELVQVFPPGIPVERFLAYLLRYQGLSREAERPAQTRRLTVLFSPEAALSFRCPGPVSVLSHKDSAVALWNRSAAEAHWVAVVEDSVEVTPDEGRLDGGDTMRLSLSLRRRGRGLAGSVAELGVFFALGPNRPASLLFPADPSYVAHINLPLNLD